ncbi:hypothetical protein ACL02R_21825 [Streptomyces sp. MS19]|uniref:hypothetical protein n=1 Tax=Streptomyces sp. MS19 TaxID=3385972 RepID=UPI0039A29E84
MPSSLDAHTTGVPARPSAAAGPVATLGPSGTSSEAAGSHLTRHIDRTPGSPVALFGTYEDARDAVLAGAADRLLVANAYREIDSFYMDLRLGLAQAFVFDTPHYGLAVRTSAPVPLKCTVVTHPAPRDLIAQLMPPGYGVAGIAFATSTSEAARHAADGGAEIALTTAPAAALHDLRFISATRPIRMLWSVFGRSGRDA